MLPGGWRAATFGVTNEGGTEMKRMLVLLAAALSAAGCGSQSSGAGTGAAGTAPTAKTRFVNQIDNPWFPLKPGTVFRYRGIKDGQPSNEVFTVMRGTQVIQGVRCTAVRDLLYIRGRLHERTSDWYAQDESGNVWYYGEATAELNGQGKVVSREGSWRAGVHGARAGVYMPGNPRPGQGGRQEFYRGHAEDEFTVVSLSARVHTAAGSSNHALLTKEFTRLEPGVLDHKYYVRGIGTVLEQTVRGGSERNELVSVHRG
jgi:hypothetical protein